MTIEQRIISLERKVHGVKSILLVFHRQYVSKASSESLLGALSFAGYRVFGLGVIDGPPCQVFRLDDSLEQIDIERIEKMCAEASK